MSEQKFGLNKSARRAAERAERALAAEPTPLEPEFPHTMRPFAATYFSAIPADSVPADAGREA